MGLQQLHGEISSQQYRRHAARTRWKDPNARSRWKSYTNHNRRSHRYDFQSLLLSVQFLVLEGGRSPSTPADFHPQWRWQPGWCESGSWEGVSLIFPLQPRLCRYLCLFDFLTNVWPDVANSSKTHFHRMVFENWPQCWRDDWIHTTPQWGWEPEWSLPWNQHQSICMFVHWKNLAIKVFIINLTLYSTWSCKAF